MLTWVAANSGDYPSERHFYACPCYELGIDVKTNIFLPFASTKWCFLAICSHRSVVIWACLSIWHLNELFSVWSFDSDQKFHSLCALTALIVNWSYMLHLESKGLPFPTLICDTSIHFLSASIKEVFSPPQLLWLTLQGFDRYIWFIHLVWELFKEQLLKNIPIQS